MSHDLAPGELPASTQESAQEKEAPEVESQQEPSATSAEPAAGEQLATELNEARRTAQDNWDKLLRAQAELENIKRRSEKDLVNAHKFALEKFAKELLPVVDSLELGLQASGDDQPEIQKLREGMELTLRQLQTVLERFNIRAIDPRGEKFDPEFHQAMAMQPSGDAPPNTVVQVFQKGYLLNDRLLRPAMVVIAQAA
jgi:molecular chaperone GrpE